MNLPLIQIINSKWHFSINSSTSVSSLYNNRLVFAFDFFSEVSLNHDEPNGSVIHFTSHPFQRHATINLYTALSNHSVKSYTTVYNVLFNLYR